MTLQEEETKAKEPKKDPLEEYCEDNPETDECRYAVLDLLLMLCLKRTVGVLSMCLSC